MNPDVVVGIIGGIFGGFILAVIGIATDEWAKQAGYRERKEVREHEIIMFELKQQADRELLQQKREADEKWAGRVVEHLSRNPEEKKA